MITDQQKLILILKRHMQQKGGSHANTKHIEPGEKGTKLTYMNGLN